MNIRGMRTPHNKDTLVGVFVLFDKIYHYIYNIIEVLLKTVGRFASIREYKLCLHRNLSKESCRKEDFAIEFYTRESILFVLYCQHFMWLFI